MLIVGLIMTVPDVPRASLPAASNVAIVLTPPGFYFRWKTIWAAIEFQVARSDPDYRTPTQRDPGPGTSSERAQASGDRPSIGATLPAIVAGG